jgi:hypothetical protein
MFSVADENNSNSEVVITGFKQKKQLDIKMNLKRQLIVIYTRADISIFSELYVISSTSN